MTTALAHPSLTSIGRLDDAARAALFTQARTANTFAATPVTDAELAEIWQLAKWPPTAANFQPLRVLFIRTEEGRARVVAHMNEGNKAKTASAPVVAVLAYDSRFHEHIPQVFPFKPEMADYFEGDEQARTQAATYNSALQSGYFLLAVRAQGLVAGPMAGFDAAALDADFFPDGRWRSTLVVNIGHPGEASWRDRLPRLADEDVVSWA